MSEMTDRELLELIATQVANITTDMSDVKKNISKIESEVKDIRNKVTLIEQDHGKKLDALFDGYKQVFEKLHKIEDEVSKHEEIILRRVR